MEEKRELALEEMEKYPAEFMIRRRTGDTRFLETR